MTDAPIYLNALGIRCSLGESPGAVSAAALHPTWAGLAATDRFSPGRAVPFGSVDGPLADTHGLDPRHRTRSNALLLSALESLDEPVSLALGRHGPDRIGVVLGTSVSGMTESEDAWIEGQPTGRLPEHFDVWRQAPGDPAEAVKAHLGLRGPAYVVSTACTGSGNALITAARLLRTGICDAVLAGGVDTLCRFTVAGFSALGATSPVTTLPSSKNRRGINLGEGAAVFLVTRDPGPVRLAGWGACSDAYHISSPDPTGRGAESAIRDALKRACLRPDEIDYVNLHGTATVLNDAMEHSVVARVLGPDVAASSTKPLTGHTLGAASAIEAGLCWSLLQDNPDGVLPPHHWDGEVDPKLAPLNLVRPGSTLGRAPRAALSNSFAFGGSNVCLVFETVVGLGS